MIDAGTPVVVKTGETLMGMKNVHVLAHESYV
jgi:hypothetical protein